MKNIFCIIALFFCLNNVVGQKIKPSINIIKAKSTIKLDGILDEQDWSNAEIASEFFQNFPADTSYAETKTSVKLTYDDNFLYIGAICLDELGGNYVIQSLKQIGRAHV